MYQEESYLKIMFCSDTLILVYYHFYLKKHPLVSYHI